MMADPHDPELKDLQQGFGDGIPAVGTHPCFDALIDHPSWVSHIRDFVSGDDTRMTAGGGGVTCRWPGQASGVHGGGQKSGPNGGGNAFGWLDEEARFDCKTVSVLLALNDVPAGGGATCAIPGSHKSNLRHPFQDEEAGHPQLLWRSQAPFERRHGKSVREGGYMDGMPGAVELTCEAGDALLLVESCVHGSAVRTLPGCRRTLLIRYGPSAKGGWKAPPEVFARLSPEARALIDSEPELPPEPELDGEGKPVLNHHGQANAKAKM